MGNFNRDDRGSGGGFKRGFGGGNRFGADRGPRPAMFRATCSECGKDCELPFRPTGERPVFCSNCFAEKQGDAGGNSCPSNFREERFERPRFEDHQMHDAICTKCGKECQVPFKPTPGKQIFCSDCFERSPGGGSKNSGAGELMDQFKILNSKIDKLLKLLGAEAEVTAGEAGKAGEDGKARKEKTKVKKVTKKAPAKKKK